MDSYHRLVTAKTSIKNIKVERHKMSKEDKTTYKMLIDINKQQSENCNYKIKLKIMYQAIQHWSIIGNNITNSSNINRRELKKCYHR